MSYNLEWRPVGGATTQVTGITDLFYDLTGLTASEDYEWRMQEDDGSAQSAWSAWNGFTTAVIEYRCNVDIDGVYCASTHIEGVYCMSIAL